MNYWKCALGYTWVLATGATQHEVDEGSHWHTYTTDLDGITPDGLGAVFVSESGGKAYYDLSEMVQFNMTPELARLYVKQAGEEYVGVDFRLSYIDALAECVLRDATYKAETRGWHSEHTLSINLEGSGVITDTLHDPSREMDEKLAKSLLAHSLASEIYERVFNA